MTSDDDSTYTPCGLMVTWKSNTTRPPVWYSEHGHLELRAVLSTLARDFLRECKYTEHINDLAGIQEP